MLDKLHQIQCSLQRKAHRTLHKSHKILHFGYLASLLIENHSLHFATVGMMLFVLSLSAALGDEL